MGCIVRLKRDTTYEEQETVGHYIMNYILPDEPLFLTYKTIKILQGMELIFSVSLFFR